MALAVGGGLMALPVVDPLEALGHHGLLATLLAGVLHGLLAWLGGSLALRRLACRTHPSWAGRRARWALGLLLGAGLGWWLLTGQAAPLHRAGADARPLMWLQLLPLLLWPAGLLTLQSGDRGHGGRGGKRSAHPTQDLRQGPGVVNQVNVPRGGQVVDLGARQARAGGRKHDVVAMAKTAQEQAAA